MTDTLTASKPAPVEPALTISVAATGQPEANVKLTWCLNKTLVEELREAQAAKPQLLISVISVTANGNRTETARYIVPITLAMKFVSFSRAGDNIVRAMVVWDPAGDITKLKRTLLSRLGDGGYEYPVFNYDLNDFSSTLSSEESIHRSAGSNECRITVPQGLFAKDPPKWLQQYVAKFVRGKAFDQCHFRKRKIAAFISMIIVLPALFMFRLLSIIALGILGMRGMNPKPLWHLFRDSSPMVWSSCDQDSVWIHKKDGQERFLPFYIINPPVILLGSLVLFIVSSWRVTRGDQEVHNLGWSYWKCLAVAAVGSVALVIGLALLLGAFFGFLWLVENSLGRVIAPEARRRRRIAKREAAERKLRQDIETAMKEAPMYLSSLDALVCGTGPKPTVVPHTKRESLMLWFDNTKHKVCKPYQR